MMQIDDEDFEQTVSTTGMVMVKFGADWCKPCVAFTPTFEKNATLFPTVLFVKVDTEEAQETCAKYAIRGIPTVVVFKDGVEIARKSGALDNKTFSEWLIQLTS